MTKLNRIFKENEYFQEVYLGKDDSIFISMQVKDNDNDRDTEIKVITNGKENYKLITENEVVVIDGRLFINQCLITSTERSTYAWCSYLDLFNITWLAATKVEKYMDNDVTYQAIGYNKEVNLPIFLHVYLDGTVNIFSFELFRGILPHYSTQDNIDKLSEAIKSVDLVSLTKPFDDEIVMSKKFSDNNLVLNVTRRLIKHLAESKLVLQARTFRAGMDNFFKEISMLFDLNSNLKFSIKEKLGYRLYYVIGGIEFNPYITSYMLESGGGLGNTINVYPAINELNFEHINGLIESLASELYKWEKENYDIFKITCGGNTVLTYDDSTSITYSVFNLDDENRGFTLKYIDEYNRPIFKIGKDICIVDAKMYDINDEPLITESIVAGSRFNTATPVCVLCTIKRIETVEKKNSYKTVAIKTVGEPLIGFNIVGNLEELSECIYENMKIRNDITLESFKSILENIIK